MAIACLLRWHAKRALRPSPLMGSSPSQGLAAPMHAFNARMCVEGARLCYFVKGSRRSLSIIDRNNNCQSPLAHPSHSVNNDDTSKGYYVLVGRCCR